MGFKDEMAAYDEDFKEVEPAPDGGGRLRDGTHQTDITECRVEENDQGFALVIKFTNQEGSIRKWYGLPPTEAQAPYYKKDFLMLGYDGPISGLEEWCESEAAMGLGVEIYIKTKPGDGRDFTNVYLNRTVEGGFGVGEGNGGNQFVPAGADGDFQGSDDDIPF